MAFFLFLLVNAVLLVRPAEFVPALQGVEIYFYVILACALAAAPDVVRYAGSRLDRQPITLCVGGLLAMVVIAGLVGHGTEEATRMGWHFAKIVVFFVLFVSLVNTPGRLKVYAGWLVVCCAAAVTVAVLQYHDVLRGTTLQAGLKDHETDRWGLVTEIRRLQFSGVFNDPNELCVWLAAMVPLALYLLCFDRNLVRRVLWAAALGLFAYGILLTGSRGGFLALLAGLGVVAWDRYGWRKAAVIGAVALPALLVVFAGRQTTMELSRSTGQTRIQIWSDWLDRFRASPVLGEGMNHKDEDAAKLAEMRKIHGIQHLAHNSYLQAFADLGLPGGCLFLGAFGVALWSVYRFARYHGVYVEPSMRELQPFVLGTVAAYATGILTLSLCFVVPTYLVLALAAAYSRVTPSLPPVTPPRFDGALVGRFALAGVGFLAATYVFVRLFVNWA